MFKIRDIMGKLNPNGVVWPGMEDERGGVLRYARAGWVYIVGVITQFSGVGGRFFHAPRHVDPPAPAFFDRNRVTCAFPFASGLICDSRTLLRFESSHSTCVQVNERTFNALRLDSLTFVNSL